MSGRMKNKVAVVTGGTRSIGKDISRWERGLAGGAPFSAETSPRAGRPATRK